MRVVWLPFSYASWFGGFECFWYCCVMSKLVDCSNMTCLARKPQQGLRPPPIPGPHEGALGPKEYEVTDLLLDDNVWSVPLLQVPKTFKLSNNSVNSTLAWPLAAARFEFYSGMTMI